MATVYQTPTELLDYTFNWSQALAPQEVISSSTWSVSPSGLSITSPASSISVAGNATTVWITGGTAGTNYVVTNTMQTTGVRTFQESLNVNIQAINNF